MQSGEKFFALTGKLGQVGTYGKKDISNFPQCRENGFYCYWNCDFPPFYEVKWIRRKWLPHGWISKIFSLYHFSPFLGQKL